MTESEKMIWAAEYVRCLDGSFRRDHVLSAANSAACAVQRLHDYLDRQAADDYDAKVIDAALEMIGKVKVR